jgi:alcohol dehydrogenase class IV
MDMAKLISVLSHQNEDIKEIVRGNITLINHKTNVLAIPTTAGSGAESTAFSVLYIDKIKYSVANHSILPDCVYLSAEFSMSSSKYLTAYSGLDAFSQAIESMWSVNSNKTSEKYAVKAISLAWRNLATAVNSNDKEAKEEMQKAAFLAGKAINITKTTAPHALSYGFTTYYNIPHGHAVVLSLAFFFRYNYEVQTNDCNDNRGAEYVKLQIEKILNLLNIEINNFENTLYNYLISIGIETDLRKLIPTFDYSLILKSINPDRLNNNPRKIHTETLHNFLNQ